MGTIEDRRVQRTKELLRSSMLELLKEKPIGKITPTELCRRANINRNTFYAHYRSPEELLDSIEDELFRRIQPLVGQRKEGDEAWGPLAGILQIFTQEQPLLQILCSENSGGHFQTWVSDLCHDIVLRDLHEKGLAVDQPWEEHIHLFSLMGSSAVITEWIRGGMKESPEEVSDFILKICDTGFAGFL